MQAVLAAAAPEFLRRMVRKNSKAKIRHCDQVTLDTRISVIYDMPSGKDSRHGRTRTRRSTQPKGRSAPEICMLVLCLTCLVHCTLLIGVALAETAETRRGVHRYLRTESGHADPGVHARRIRRVM